EDLPALEGAGRLVLLAHRVGAVGADAEPAAEAELARLRPHRALSDELIVDVELRGAQRLAVLARLLPDELDSDGVLAGFQLAFRDEVLLGPDAEEVVDVVELAVFDKQDVPAEARAPGENDAGRAGIVEHDVREDLVGAVPDIRRDRFGNGRRVR